MNSARYDKEFFVIAFEFLESILAEIAGVRFLAMNYKHGTADLIAVLQNGHIQKRQCGRGIPSVV